MPDVNHQIHYQSRQNLGMSFNYIMPHFRPFQASGRPALQPCLVPARFPEMTLVFVRRALIAAAVGAQALLVGAYDNSRFDNVSRRR